MAALRGCRVLRQRGDGLGEPIAAAHADTAALLPDARRCRWAWSRVVISGRISPAAGPAQEAAGPRLSRYEGRSRPATVIDESGHGAAPERLENRKR